MSAVPRLLAFSSILLACARPTMGSGNSARSQTHQDNWHCEQDQQYRWVRVRWDGEVGGRLKRDEIYVYIYI